MPFRAHLHTVNRHRRLVRHYCFKLGLVWQGLTHDLSKYSPTEFWRSVKYYQMCLRDRRGPPRRSHGTSSERGMRWRSQRRRRPRRPSSYPRSRWDGPAGPQSLSLIQILVPGQPAHSRMCVCLCVPLPVDYLLSCLLYTSFQEAAAACWITSSSRLSSCFPSCAKFSDTLIPVSYTHLDVYKRQV